MSEERVQAAVEHETDRLGHIDVIVNAVGGNKGKAAFVDVMSSYVPLSGVWAHDAGNARVPNLTMAAAREFAPYGIRVNAIAPGFFLGKQNRALMVNESTGLTARGREIVACTPCARFGTAAELAGAVVFLASEAASGFITGICIPADGE